MTALTPDEIRERLAATRAAAAAAPATTPAAPATTPNLGLRHLKPLSEAVDELVAQAQTSTTGERIMLGIPEFDEAMRGLAPKEMLVIAGFAHSGKTLVTTELLRTNRHRRVLMITADEDRVLVLAKLVSLVSGIPAEEMERRIAAGDQRAIALIREVATETFPTLAIVDDVATLGGMSTVFREATDLWGAPPEVVIFDYLDLLDIGGDGGGDTRSKFSAIKAWGKDQSVPLVIMHQASRSGGADGQEITLTSGAYGGEQQATFIVGVRRQRDHWKSRIRELEDKQRNAMRPSEALPELIAEARWQYEYHANTITLNLVKNKRPPGRLVDDVDFVLEANTGRIRPAGYAPPEQPNESEWATAEAEAELWEDF